MEFNYPHSLQAERSVLGANLVSENAAIVTMSSLVEEDFYDEKHRLIFRAIKGVYDRNQSIDVTTVTEELLNTKHLDEVGGVSTLVEFFDGVVIPGNIEYYVNIIKEHVTGWFVCTSSITIPKF